MTGLDASVWMHLIGCIQHTSLLSRAQHSNPMYNVHRGAGCIHNGEQGGEMYPTGTIMAAEHTIFNLHFGLVVRSLL